MSETVAEAVEEALPADNELVGGVVATIDPLTVTVRGGTVTTAGTLGSYIPAIGDPVQLVREGATWLVLGSSAGTDDATATVASFAANTPAATTAGAGYSNVMGALLSFRKRSNGSRVRVDASVSAFLTAAANTKPGYGFDFINTSGGASVRVDMMEMTINPVSTHTMVAGNAVFSGIGAGDYTVQLIWRRVAGAGTLNINADDWVSFTVAEVA